MRRLVLLGALVALPLNACGASPSAQPTTPAPTVEQVSDASSQNGACRIMVTDPGLAPQVVAAVEKAQSPQTRTVTALQEQLFAVRLVNHGRLGDLAGTMVDYLDDPAAWSSGGKADPAVLQTLAKVREACRSS